MHERLITMLAELRERTDFESAATAILRAVMDVVAGTCVAHDGATILRAMVHHRPADGYRRLAVMDRDAEVAALTGFKEAFLPSATAWRWIVENKQPASIDVNLALIQTEAPDGPGPTTDPGLLATGSTSHDSRLRLLRRGATHVYVVPVFGLRGSVDGLVSIEAHCPSAVGSPFGWTSCAKDLEVLAALAAPFVSELPLRPSQESSTDALDNIVRRGYALAVTELGGARAFHRAVSTDSQFMPSQ